MAVHEIIPTENLSIQDIIDTVVANGGQLAEGLSSWHDVRSLFTEAANINLASKHKPIIRAVNFCQDFDSSKPNYLANWWQGADGNCGITPKYFTNFESIPSAVDGKNNGWGYAMPQGGASAPLRLGDFAGYYPKARLMLEGFSVPQKVYIKDSTSFEVVFDKVEPNDYQLAVEDLPLITIPEYAGLNGGHWGVVITNESGGIVARLTTASVDDTTLSVLTRDLETGVMYVYPFVSQYFIGQNEPDRQQGYLYTIPQASPAKITIMMGSIDITLSASVFSDGTISYSAVIVNDLDSNRTFSGTVVYERKFSSPNADGTMTEEWINIDTENLGSVTIPSLGVKQLSGSITMTTIIAAMRPDVRVTLTLTNVYSEYTAQEEASWN